MNKQTGLGLRDHVVTIATPGVLDVVSVWVDMDDPVMMKNAEEALEVMQRVMVENDMALGISAIQVGVALRVMALRLERVRAGDLRFKKVDVMFNPVYTVINGNNPGIAEGCLSVPEITMNISRRARVIEVRWQDWDRVMHVDVIDGLAAVLFQHEVDHMNGKTIIDGATRQVRREAYKQATKGGSR